MKRLKASLRNVTEILKKDVDIVDESGCILHSSRGSREGEVIEGFDPSGIPSMGGRHGYYVHIANGSYEEINLTHLILKDKFESGTADNYQQFLINIIDGFENPAEYCREFSIPREGTYVVYCISLLSDRNFHDTFSLISNSFQETGSAWVFSYNGHIILLEKVEGYMDDIKANARTIVDMVNSEVYTGAYVGIGDVHKGILNIKKSFEEAKQAIEAGRMFNLPENIYSFRDTLPERIISLLPQGKIDELALGVTGDEIDEILDGDTIKTVEVMFKNNLNISDSSKVLYIHRNTLLYRIDKIQKVTGLDIRRFEDAVIFKLSFLVNKRRKR